MFSSVNTGDIASKLSIANEIYEALEERWLICGEPSGYNDLFSFRQTFVGKTSGQLEAFTEKYWGGVISNAQSSILQMLEHFCEKTVAGDWAGRNITDFPSSTLPSSYNPALTEEKLGDILHPGNSFPFRAYRVHPNDGGTPEYRQIRFGDIIGTWLIEDIQNAISCMKYTWSGRRRTNGSFFRDTVNTITPIKRDAVNESVSTGVGDFPETTEEVIGILDSRYGNVTTYSASWLFRYDWEQVYNTSESISSGFTSRIYGSVDSSVTTFKLDDVGDITCDVDVYISSSADDIYNNRTGDPPVYIQTNGVLGFYSSLSLRSNEKFYLADHSTVFPSDILPILVEEAAESVNCSVSSVYEPTFYISWKDLKYDNGIY